MSFVQNFVILYHSKPCFWKAHFFDNNLATKFMLFYAVSCVFVYSAKNNKEAVQTRNIRLNRWWIFRRVLRKTVRCTVFLHESPCEMKASNALRRLNPPSRQTRKVRLGKRDSNTHCLTMDVFAIFQFVGFDRRQPACILPHWNLAKNISASGASSLT